jgi:hypothetical protein
LVAPLTPKQAAGDTQIRFSEINQGFAIHHFNYHTDDVPIPIDKAINPYTVPTPEMAKSLFDAYMDRVHPSFPVVGRVTITSHFRRFINGAAPNPPHKWFAILNLIFAIGARYSHLAKTKPKGDEADDLMYFSRARLLVTSSETIFDLPDLKTIQIRPLTSFYTLTAGRVNRSWLLLGLAIREACGLGLNLRNASPLLTDNLKETRYRLWWALYTLENQLCIMSGRASCIRDEYCTTPLLVPLEEEDFEAATGRSLFSKESQQGVRAPYSDLNNPATLGLMAFTDQSRRQTNSGLGSSAKPGIPPALEWVKDTSPKPSQYFLHLVQLSRLMQHMFHELYASTSLSSTWPDMQIKMQQLEARLERWRGRLPQLFALGETQHERRFYESRLTLRCFFHTAKMLIHRPCLSRLNLMIPNRSAIRVEFYHKSAAACVEVAKEMLQLIPDKPNAAGLFCTGPWWNMSHWLVQAASVLMLGISYLVFHTLESFETLLEASRKAVRWLHALAADDPSAQRAADLCQHMLHFVAEHARQMVEDVPQRPPVRPSSNHTSPPHICYRRGSRSNSELHWQAW